MDAAKKVEIFSDKEDTSDPVSIEQKEEFSIGTDCSGLDIPILALENIGVKFKHKFSCDNDRQIRIRSVQGVESP